MVRRDELQGFHKKDSQHHLSHFLHVFFSKGNLGICLYTLRLFRTFFPLPSFYHVTVDSSVMFFSRTALAHCKRVGTLMSQHKLQSGSYLQAVRFYRGDSPEQTQRLSEKERELTKISLVKDLEIKKRHFQLPDDEDVRRKRLIYRSKQRGWMEVDVLLGTWASQNVPSLSVAELDEFEEFVNEETIDIYNMITLKTDIPEKFDNNEVVKRIQNWCETSPLGKADQNMFRKAKEEHNLI